MTRRLYRSTFRAMGTDCGLTVVGGEYQLLLARRAIVAAVDEIEACERSLSRFDPASELTRLNAAGGVWFDASPRLFGAVSQAVDARLRTGGRFDPTVLPAMLAAGYDRSFEQLAQRWPDEPAGWRAGGMIDIDPAGRLRLRDGVTLDLGGIGKGYSGERAAEAMLRAWPQMPGALVDLGGDIAVRGCAQDGNAWQIGVADPRGRTVRLGIMHLDEGGIATSGRDRRRFGRGRSQHHLIDPGTGRPAGPGPLTVTVRAGSAAEAEVHATALAITPVTAAARYVAERPGLSALIVPEDGAHFCAGPLGFIDQTAPLHGVPA
jgi:thiamine biosynthesis lipoprotein